MRKLLGPALFGILVAAVSHLAVIYYAPSFIMSRATSMLEGRGAQLHLFELAERTTPQSQSVVRPSPDLAYSICLFDLDQAPSGLLVRMAATDGYASLSFFDAATNNFKTIRGDGDGIEVRLLPPGSAPEEPQQIVSPTATGIMLIRRLAPTEDDYQRVASIAQGDSCVPFGA